MENKTEWRPGPTVCRCCLAEGCYKDISTEYFWMGKREVYAEMLADTLDLTIGYSSSAGPYSNSRLICEPCITRLRDACDFKRQVQECEKTFMQQLNPENIPSVDVVVQPLETTVKVEAVKSEVPVSDDDGLSDVDFGVATADDDDDDDDDELDNEPLTKLASKVPKKEKDMVDLIDLADNRKATEKRKSSAKSKASPAKKAKTAAKVNEPVASASTASASKVEKKKKGDRKNDPIRSKQNQDASILVNNSNITLFKWKNREYMCFCCKCTFLEMTKLREHSEEQHTKTEIIQEIHKRYSPVLPKADITKMTCQFDSCQTKIKSIRDLIEHLKLIHNIYFEGTEEPVIPYKLGNDEFRCQKCDTNFRFFKNLNTHMNTHFSVFICSTCGDGFQHKVALRNHELRHKKHVHRCNKCNLVFPTSYKQLVHYYTVHKKGGRYGCPHCDEKFMDYEKRQNHLAAIHGYKRPESRCMHCTKIFKSQRLLQQHVRKVVNKQHDAISEKLLIFQGNNQ